MFKYEIGDSVYISSKKIQQLNLSVADYLKELCDKDLKILKRLPVDEQSIIKMPYYILDFISVGLLITNDSIGENILEKSKYIPNSRLFSWLRKEI
jgi:hypothetical protein